MRRRTYLPLLLVAAPGVMALGIVSPAGAAGSDNGVANQTGTQIVTAAAAATAGAKSFTYKGTQNGSSTVTSNLSVTTSGNGQGSVVVGGQPVKVIKVGDTVYMNSTKAFWTKNAGAAAGELIGTRWVAAPATDAAYSGLASQLDATHVAAQFSNPSGSAFTKGKTSTIKGQQVIAINGKGNGNGGTLYVATTGQPYIIRVTGSGSSITFSNYNKLVNPTVPSNPIDITKLSSTTTTTG
jgi:hypothetical protein